MGTLLKRIALVVMVLLLYALNVNEKQGLPFEEKIREYGAKWAQATTYVIAEHFTSDKIIKTAVTSVSGWLPAPLNQYISGYLTPKNSYEQFENTFENNFFKSNSSKDRKVIRIAPRDITIPKLNFSIPEFSEIEIPPVPENPPSEFCPFAVTGKYTHT